MKDITLPIELSALSLEEIGSIFLIMAMPHLSEEDKRRWSEDIIFMKTLKLLMDEEIIMVDEKEVDINLTWV